ncbi:MAG TPA: hypothetical protein VFR14_05915 [Candidatus Limnocylindrales bacterium]|nr:hypothetical protein [Candidatus Limnocylindrales bacterium]
MARRLRVLTAFIASALLAAGSVAPASADVYPLDVEVWGTGNQVFVGGDYGWYVDIWGVGDLANPLSVTVDWDDGSAPTTITTSDPEPLIWCDSGHCGTSVPHTYLVQGLYELTFSAAQEGTAGGTATWQQLVVDLDAGGSARGSGTVYAPPGGGGMYDQDFTGGTASFKFDTRRRAGTSATTASVTISVPSMTADDGDTGMTFTGKAPLEVLYIAPARGGGEIVLARVYGAVTNSGGSAGNGYAIIQARIVSRTTTLIRLGVWNASAGYTYVDTGWQPAGFYGLDPVHDLLVTGSVRIN